MKEMEATLEITALAAGGDGVGRTDGMVVFVPRTAVGDIARVRVTPAKKFGRGVLLGLDRESPDRVAPPCAHYVMDRCGGCQVQHLSYDAQLRAKRTIIGDAVRRIGRREAPDPEVVASESQWRYRRKLTLHLRWTGKGWIAGLHPFDDPVSVFDLHDCPITGERVLDAWKALRPLFPLLPHERALRASVRIVDDVVAVTVEGGTRWPGSAEFFRQATVVTELWWKPEHGRVRRLAAREAGSAGDGAGAFVQVNARVAALLRDRVLARVRAHEGERVIDAYAGSGATAVPLARDGRTVVAIEWDNAAVKAMSSQLRAPSRAIAGRVEDHLSSELPADVVLLNPPRTGVDQRVTAALQSVARAPGLLVYVSCDPATLARDLARLSRYRLADMRAYDMFPQTAHVETVCELVPEAA